MIRLPVLLSLLAILGAAALAVLYVRSDRARQRLATELATARMQLAKTETDLATAQEQNTALEQRIVTLQGNLGQAQSQLSAADERGAQLTRELAQAAADRSLREETHRAMEQHLAGLERDLAAARNAITPPDTLERFRNTIADLERQLAAAHNGAAAPGMPGASTAVFATRPPVSARILSVGPSNSFVVLNYGAERGAAVGQRFVVRRGTEALADVLISDVRTLLSIAQVQPDSLRGVLHKGDSAVLTN